jgi:hypothetical protein
VNKWLLKSCGKISEPLPMCFQAVAGQDELFAADALAASIKGLLGRINIKP